jgi:manganese transport protein
MFPLVHFVSSKKIMGNHRIGWFLMTVSWASCILITALDLYGLPESLGRAWHIIIGG